MQLALIRIEQIGPRLGYLIWFGLALLGTALTHYFSIGALSRPLRLLHDPPPRPGAIQNARRLRRRRILFLLLWAPQLLAHLRQFLLPGRTTEFLYDAPNGHLARVLTNFVSLPIVHLINLPSPSIIWPILGAALFILILSSIARRRDLLFWWLYLAGTIGLILLLDLTRGTQQLFFTRYTLIASPALFALLRRRPRALEKSPPRHPRRPRSSLHVYLPRLYNQNRPDFQDLARLLDQTGRRDLLIFAAPTKGPAAPAQLYLGYSHYSNPQHHSAIILMTDMLPPDVQKHFSSYQNIWLINASPEILPTQLLPDHAFQGPAQTRFPATIWKVPRNPASLKSQRRVF